MIARAGTGSLAFLLVLSACASEPVGTGDTYARFDAGFRRLGASEERGRCFSEKLSRGDAADEAARIVESSASKADMQERVLSADEATRRAFIRASFGCSLFS